MGKFSATPESGSLIYYLGLETNSVYRKRRGSSWSRKQFFIGPRYEDHTYDSKLALEYTQKLTEQNL